MFVNAALLERFGLYLVVMILALGYYQAHIRMPVLIHNPETGVSQVLFATRDAQQQMLHESGLRHAVAMATGSFPFQIEDPERPLLSERQVAQYFTDDLVPFAHRRMP